MTWVYKQRGVPTVASEAEFRCPTHGVFVASNADAQLCPVEGCGEMSPWTITSAPLGRMKKIEAVRGGWEKPARPTYLDTRELGEGMPKDEWLEKRRKIRDEQRWKEVKEML